MSADPLDVLAPPEIEFYAVAEDHVVLYVARYNLKFDLAHIRRDRNAALVGEVMVTWPLAGAPTTAGGVLDVSTLNLSSTTARQTYARALAALAGQIDGVDLRRYLNVLALDTIARERRGHPSIDLRNLPLREAPRTVQVAGFPVSLSEQVGIFSDGGGGKSTFAKYLAGTLTRTHGWTVAYLDWESDDEYAMRDDLAALFGPDVPNVRYVPCHRPLSFEVDRLRRLKRDEAWDYAVYDSTGFGMAGDPSDAQDTLAYYRAAKQLGIGGLHLSHTNRGDQSEEKPFGSTYHHNSLRMTWFLKASDPTLDASERTVALFNKKNNRGPRLSARAYRFAYERDGCTVTRTDIAEIADLAARLPVRERLRLALRHGPQAIDDLAEDLGIEKNTIRQAVKRATDTFITLSDGPKPRIALVERRAS